VVTHLTLHQTAGPFLAYLQPQEFKQVWKHVSSVSGGAAPLTFPSSAPSSFRSVSRLRVSFLASFFFMTYLAFLIRVFANRRPVIRLPVSA
jgi:hypothetical protein